MRADEDIQFSPIEYPEVAPEAEPQEPPSDWLVDFVEWLADVFGPVGRFLSMIWPVGKFVLLAAGIALICWWLYNSYSPGGKRAAKASRKRKREKRDEWVPEQSAAMALLEEADRLAAAGDYDEATHLLLKRSVGQIAEARPDLVEPSSTARELASEPRLPEAARTAFGTIAVRVERSLFALRKLGQDDWQAARAAYADFALAQKTIASHTVNG